MGFIELKNFFFIIEYFIGIIIIYLLLVYLFLINNIFGLFVQKALSDCFSFIFIILSYLIINDSILFSVDFNNITFINFNKLIVFDYLSSFSKLIISFISLVFFFIISNLLKGYKLASFELLILLLFVILGLLFLCSSSDFLLIFISIELVALASYFLVSFNKNFSNSIEYGIKYLIIGATSSSIFLLGISFIYFYTGSILLHDINILTFKTNFLLFNSGFYFNKHILCFELLNLPLLYKFNLEFWFFEHLIINSFLIKNSKPFLEMGLLLIFVSIIIKISLAPFHLWSVNIYEGAPSIITFFFLIVTKLSYFIILFRIYYFIITDFNFVLNLFYLSIGFLSIIVGSFGNLRQRKIKTLLTYSSISHMGYVLIAFSSNLLLSFEMFYFYFITYIISSIIIWFIILTLKQKTKNYKYRFAKNIGDLILLNKSNKALSLGFLIVLFSIAGVPPLVGFLAKFGVFFSLILKEYYTLTFIIALCSLISTFYYIRIIKILYFENIIIGNLYLPIDYNSIVIFCLSVFLLNYLFINPKFLYLLIHKVLLHV